MPSFRARLLESWLRLTGAKHVTNMIDLVYPLDATHTKPGRGLRRRHAVTETEFAGRTVYTVAPKTGGTTRHVYYLHGGAYYNGFLPPHWDFLDDMVTVTGCTVTAPDFPLAPDATADDIYAMVVPVYAALAERHGSEKITVMGDSSGGGMALVLAMKARTAGLPQPNAAVLLSPWLDVSMSNPDARAACEKDPLLGFHACCSAGERYAAGTDPRHPDLSPIFGDLRGLAPIVLFIGTHDVMLADCRKLKAKAAAAGAAYTHAEYPEMIHDWMLLTLPESRRARDEIYAVVGR